MHLCTENIRSRIRSPRSLPSKIHAATPPQNFAAVESLLRAKRAARSSFSWPHALLSKRNRQDQHAVYLAAAFPIGTKWLGALFTYVRHSVRARHSYDLASYMHTRSHIVRWLPWPLCSFKISLMADVPFTFPTTPSRRAHVFWTAARRRFT